MTRPPRPLRRRLAYVSVVLVVFFALATALLAGLERAGWLDTFRQDDSVLYLQGQYLRPSADGQRYEIRDAQSPQVVQASVPTHKARGTFRVFVTGESFVRGGHHIPPGVPPVGYGTITDWMSQLLEARYPSVTFEVVNAGANGQGSYRVSQVVEELVRAQPDLVVVAVGNNEGVVPLLGASRELNDWILYRFVKKAVLPEPAREDRPAWPVQALSPGRIEAAFVANVGRMVAAARAADVPLALATLPLNVVDIANTITAPELSQADPACRASVALAGQGQCDRGLEAGAACPQPFLVAARGAECLRAAGRYDEARELYEVAIQVDPRGRTRPSYNDALRRIARDERLLLVDLDAGMRARSPNGLPGSPPFIDAVHLTCMGYLPVARDIVETIVAAGLVHGGWSEPRPSPSAAELLERHPWDATVGPQAPSPGLVERTRRVCAADASQG